MVGWGGGWTPGNLRCPPPSSARDNVVRHLRAVATALGADLCLKLTIIEDLPRCASRPGGGAGGGVPQYGSRATGSPTDRWWWGMGVGGGWGVARIGRPDPDHRCSGFFHGLRLTLWNCPVGSDPRFPRPLSPIF